MFEVTVWVGGIFFFLNSFQTLLVQEKAAKMNRP
jgi:hypothetical protein